MAIAVPLNQKKTKKFLRWSGGGLGALISLGLHGLLLGLPLAPTPSPPLAPPPEPPEPGAMIDVVRLPAAPAPGAQAIPEATPTPASSITQAPRAAGSSQPLTPVLLPPGAEPEPPLPEPIALEPLAPEPPPPTLDERLRDPAEYQFNEQAKSLIADEITFNISVVPTWLEAEGQGLSDNDAPVMGTKLAPITVTYPITTCLMPPPAEGLVGVIVGTNGQLVKEPVLLDSTGYSVLDDKALEMASQRTFEPLANASLPNPRAHWLPVQVQYNPANCTP